MLSKERSRSGTQPRKSWASAARPPFVAPWVAPVFRHAALCGVVSGHILATRPGDTGAPLALRQLRCPPGMLCVTPLLGRVPPRWLSAPPTRAARSRALFAASLRGAAVVDRRADIGPGIAYTSCVPSWAVLQTSVGRVGPCPGLSLQPVTAPSQKSPRGDRGWLGAPAPSRCAF